ncbi:MAG: HD-GYP domain-containing protein [Thermoanaerobaculales bacterium]
MSIGLPGWSPEIEKGFKEILFRFLEEIQCTKAALYLFGPDDSFVLATQYGFGRRDLLAAEHRARDPLTVKARSLGDKPRAFNRSPELGPLADYFKQGRTSRVLLVPLVDGQEMIGFVDARDKGRKRAFEPRDSAAAKNIAAALLDLARQSGFAAPADTTEATFSPPVWSAPVMPGRRSDAGVPRAPMLDDPSIEELHDAALDVVLEDQVVAVAVTLATSEGAATLVYLRQGGADVDRPALILHQEMAMAEVGLAAPAKGAWQVEVRRAPATADPSAATMIASAVLLKEPEIGALIVSVIGGGGAARSALERVRGRARHAHDKSVLRFTRRNLARRLLQPGEQTFPDLVAHSEAVSRLAWAVALALDWGAARAEEAAVAGLLHDVGMRELDYERLYRNPSPTTDDRRMYQEHPATGEKIVAGTGLDDVAAAIRHHHERWDGNGYPDRLVGESIPILARLVHVAEVYDVLSSTGRYRPTLSPDKALEVLSRAAGHQFDPATVEALSKVVPEMSGSRG